MPETLSSATKIVITAKSKKELAAELKISRNTVGNVCKRLGIITDGKLLSPKQVLKFYREYGAYQELSGGEVSF